MPHHVYTILFPSHDDTLLVLKHTAHCIQSSTVCTPLSIEPFRYYVPVFYLLYQMYVQYSIDHLFHSVIYKLRIPYNTGFFRRWRNPAVGGGETGLFNRSSTSPLLLHYITPLLSEYTLFLRRPFRHFLWWKAHEPSAQTTQTPLRSVNF